MPKHLTLADFPPGSQYAAGSNSKLQWKWKPVDQKYIDQCNATIDRINSRQPTPEPKTKGKKRGNR